MPSGDTNGVSSWKKEVVQGTEFTVPSSYNLVKKLGSGAYGTVAAFEDKAASPPRTVAVKLVKSAFNDLIDAKRIVREVTFLISPDLQLCCEHFDHTAILDGPQLLLLRILRSACCPLAATSQQPCPLALAWNTRYPRTTDHPIPFPRFPCAPTK